MNDLSFLNEVPVPISSGRLRPEARPTDPLRAIHPPIAVRLFASPLGGARDQPDVAQAVTRSGLVGGAIGLFSSGAINLHCANIAPRAPRERSPPPPSPCALGGALLIAHWTRA